MKAPAIRKRYGPSVSVYIDGNGGQSDISVSCDLAQETECLCPFALGFEMPMPPGSRCILRNFTDCRAAAARLAALESTARIVARRIKAEREEMEE